MAEQIVTLFGKELQPKLFPANDFYKQSKVDGGIDINAKFVEVPQAGASPTVIVNPTSFPLTPGQRTDDVLVYGVDHYATTPTLITDVNEMIINYSKRASVIQDHADVLNSRVAAGIGYAWSPTLASQISRTTGTADASALAPGATGVRKVLTRADLSLLATKFDRDDVPSGKRNLLIDADLYAQLLNIDTFINFDYVNRKPTVDGQVGEIFGMKVFKRSSTTIYDNSATPGKKAVGAASGITDNLGILAWAENQVRRAEGQNKVYSNMDDALYLGSIFNAAVRSGGSFARTDQKGVYALVQSV